MKADNFVLRPHRRAIERFQDRANWDDLDIAARTVLADELAGLPSAFRDENVPAKQFDLLIVSTQLFLLRGDPAFAKTQARIREFTSSLETLGNEHGSNAAPRSDSFTPFLRPSPAVNAKARIVAINGGSAFLAFALPCRPADAA